MLQTAVDWLQQKTKYLKMVPWLFARACDPSVARDIVRQIASKPLELHHHVTQAWVRRGLVRDIQAVADGNPPTEVLLRETKILQKSPCDETPGEGYHRSTSYALNRARSSTLVTIKASVRNKQNIQRAKRFIKFRRLRHYGRRVFVYEWMHFKRVLQVNSKRKWKPVRMKDNHELYTIVFLHIQLAKIKNLRSKANGAGERYPKQH